MFFAAFALYQHYLIWILIVSMFSLNNTGDQLNDKPLG